MAYTCKILAIDGGGIRGVIPAYILQQLEAALNGKQLYECFDIIAGTSTGGIITLGLTTPISANNGTPYTGTQILGFYMNDESDLFVAQPVAHWYDEPLQAKYYGTSPSGTGIEPWLQSQFGATLTLSQAQTQLKALGNPVPWQVLTTCYTLTGAQAVTSAPYLFNWQSAAANPGDDYYVWEAARATSAAPTYFPLAQVGSGAANGSNAVMRWAADGGVVANNPAMYALSQATAGQLFQSFEEVLLVSLGTGQYDPGVTVPDTGNWGTAQWGAGTSTDGYAISPLISVLLMGNVLAPWQQLASLLPATSFYRLDPTIPYAESSMDGTDTAALLATATNYIAAGGDGYNAFNAVVTALTGGASKAATR